MSKNIPFAIFFICLLVAGLVISVFNPEPVVQNTVKKFNSYDELAEFVKTNSQQAGYGYGLFETTTAMRTTSADSSALAGSGAADYSQTNIQVEGVDEADIVKNDGRYIYTVSGNSVSIVDAFPAENAKIVANITFDSQPMEIYINGDKLVVFGNEYNYGSNAFVKVYDVTDRANPTLTRDVSINGSYYGSRMIGDYIYVIAPQFIYYYNENPIPMPVITDSGVTKTVAASEIYYFDVPDTSYQFTNIVSVNTQNDNEAIKEKTFLMGNTQNLFVSTDNIYVVYTKYLSQKDYYIEIIEKAILPIIPADIASQINEIRNDEKMAEWEKWSKIQTVVADYSESLTGDAKSTFDAELQKKTQDVTQEISKRSEQTIVHKIAISNGNIEYKTNGKVPGHTLNQFSMDEYNGYFRIATTTGGGWINGASTSANHVYVLDNSLQVTGKLEDLAKGERIYSVRFMGNKAYMVTFRQIDPLFVIDLSDPSAPSVLGFLKIPGVSDYLHPYDETHVIGVGRDATEEGRITGMKLSLFDVSDVANPTEVSKYMIGTRGTNSEALNDHKAFLFDKAKNLLVIPVTIYEEDYRNQWNGAMVFSVDLTDGFVLKGKITHTNATSGSGTENYYYYDWSRQIKRSLYMDDTLYTISNSMIKANSLADLSELGVVELPYSQSYGPYVYRTGVGVIGIE
ncbi:MAG: beta-propeller domain-containing protein [Candidatus Aenigmatarchaeota archaeon]